MTPSVHDGGSHGCRRLHGRYHKGVEYVEKMCYDLSKRLGRAGIQLHPGGKQGSPSKLPPVKEHISGLKFHFTPFQEDSTTKKCEAAKVRRPSAAMMPGSSPSRK